MSVVPTGTVTFLFTDIEGSTRRWEQHAEPMKLALARHDEILRGAITVNGGHVFKTVGDGFYAAFATALDALTAAVDAQRAMAAEAWSECEGLRVRMACHTGAVQYRDGDYFGQAPNRVARLLNTGHGGQTLLSLATQELVRDQLPDGVQLRDLGAHRLRDLIRPEQIFQVVAHPLPADFPPLKTLDARPNNLQIQPTPLLGREREVKQLCANLCRDDVRLLTLTGPGGTGKTRLALQVAADLLDDYKDGVYFVALAPISDPTLVVSTIAQTLGVKESGGRSILQCLEDYLREKTVLLALDNFEQVTDAATQVASLLGSSPRLNLLVTSRIPLHVRGEHEFAVSPLAVPDIKHLPELEALSQYASVELFIRRAQAVKPDFSVDNENAPAVAGICVRLDGLPLAIELAAARVKLLTPRAMLRRLEDPLTFLTGGPRDLSARQQTLRGAIAWSYDLLGDNEKRLFYRMAVFVGGFTLEAAVAVCETVDFRGDVFEGIAGLIDESLLGQKASTDGEPRFFMLETIREYSQERLEESQEKEECHRRHLEFFVELAEKGEIALRSAEQLTWLDRLELEHDNLRAAIDWSIQTEQATQLGLRLGGALSRFWRIRGHFSEGRERLTCVLGLPIAIARTADRAKALCGVGSMLAYLNQLDAQKFALHCLDEGVVIWRELGENGALASALAYSALVTYRLNRRPAALVLAEESVALSEKGDDKWVSALCMHHLGVLMFWRGDCIRARSLGETCIAVYRRLGDKAELHLLLDLLGWITFTEGNPINASLLTQECIALRRELGDDWWTAEGLRDLASMAFCQGDYTSARASSEADLAILRKLGNMADIASSLFFLADYTRYYGDDAKAVALFDACLSTARRSGDNDVLANLLYRVGAVAFDQREYDRARALYEEDLAIVAELEGKHLISWPLKGLGDLARLEGEEDKARVFYDRSLDAARASQNENTITLVLRDIGDVVFDQCDFAQARLLWEERFAIHRQANYKLGIAASLLCLGSVAHYCADFRQAIALFDESIPISRELGQQKGVALSLCGIAGVAYAEGNVRRARDLLEQGVATLRQLPDIRNLTSPLGCLARVECVQGDFEAACATLKESVSISKHTRDKRGIAEALAGFAKVAQAQNDASRAALLFGAAESLHKFIGPRLSPMDHHDHAHVVRELRAALDDEAFGVAWSTGRSMTPEQAVAFALDE